MIWKQEDPIWAKLRVLFQSLRIQWLGDQDLWLESNRKFWFRWIITPFETCASHRNHRLEKFFITCDLPPGNQAMVEQVA
jgi:hypothetical protein